MNYHHLVLDPADELTARLLTSRAVLGIEMTDPHLASLCRLGNVDPQHDPHLAGPGIAAVEAACDWPLPPTGSTLATIRKDLDALGAMAVLELRKNGIHVDRSNEVVRAIAAADGAPGMLGPWAPGAGTRDRDQAGGGTGALHTVLRQRGLSLHDAIAAIASAIESLRFPDPLPESAALDLGEIVVELVAEPHPLAGRLAVVRSTSMLAIGAGYDVAPMVLAENSSFAPHGGTPRRKLTLAQYGPGYFHLGHICSELNSREPGWGGTPTIIGSPQDRSSRLAVAEVLAAVAHVHRAFGEPVATAQRSPT